ncbi:MAG TPA: hypothetical protein PLE24_03035 [Chitinispirillaceae bacterium]|nr:hypothetical protein [Chitinispirillaceae bacterium]
MFSNLVKYVDICRTPQPEALLEVRKHMRRGNTDEKRTCRQPLMRSTIAKFGKYPVERVPFAGYLATLK